MKLKTMAIMLLIFATTSEIMSTAAESTRSDSIGLVERVRKMETEIAKLSKEVENGNGRQGRIWISQSSPASFEVRAQEFRDVPNLTLTIDTRDGRPIWLFLAPAGEPKAGEPKTGLVYSFSHKTGPRSDSRIWLVRNGERIQGAVVGTSSESKESNNTPVSAIMFMDFPEPGKHTYKIQVHPSANHGAGIAFENARLIAYELNAHLEQSH